MTNFPRLLITAPSSGSGKTLFTCGLLQALLNRRLKPAACKCGPDYIDPLFHRKVLGIPSRNLDSFFSDEESLCRSILKGKGNDLTVLEGVMGYYDGIGGVQTEGSSYDIAGKTQTPAVLILPCRGMSLSAAAVLKGMLHYKKDSMIRGVVFNKISPKIYDGLKEVIENDPELSVKVLGYLPERNDIHLESRHLGLVTPDEIGNFKEQLEILAKQIEETVDLDGLLKLAGEAAPLISRNSDRTFHNKAEKNPIPAKPPVIAAARDEAFCFYYEETLEALAQLGAEISFFSPCRDTHLPEHACALYLPGGYPELHAEALSSNHTLRKEIREKISGGLPCIAECGGFMYLHAFLEDKNGISYPMCSVIPETCFPQKTLGHFGYITLTAQTDTAFLKKGAAIRGHEFHYWQSTHNGTAFSAKKPTGTRSWQCIHSTGTLLAGYPHFWFPSNPALLKNFINAAIQYQFNKKGASFYAAARR
jgi:cobyrinic acid a,c-diamide synthase